jgi:uncharacterized protein with ParB-like and HNH nuclease domain
MSKLHETSITIYEALQHINSNKYIMPAFQRQFVWSMEQIEKLWDSILLHYPIATFLFWRLDDDNTNWDTSFSNFRRDLTFNERKESDSVDYDLVTIDLKTTDTAILDGQQRLTSLYLSLLGEAYIRPTYARKAGGERHMTRLMIELNKNKTETDEEEYNTKRFDIKFHYGKSSPTHFNIKDILQDKFQNDSTRNKAIEDTIAIVPPDSKEYARAILETLYRKIFVEKLVRYTEILEMGHDDALEMFVRFNAGGKPLRKHEVTMAIIEAYWSQSKTEFGKLLTGAYNGFGTDFIIRTALMLYGDVLKSTISRKVVDELRDNWGQFKKALNNVDKLLKGFKIETSRFAGSWNVLLPIVYSVYYDHSYEDNADAIRAYLLRSIFFTYFQSGTTSKLNQMRNRINEYSYKITFEMLDNDINDLRVTDGKIEDILGTEKGSRVAGEVLHYLSVEWLSNAYKYEQDHLHPESRFNPNTKPPTITPEKWTRWRLNRNRLPSIHLLEGRSNSSKGAKPLIDFYSEMNMEQRSRFMETAMIPADISFEVERFEEFYEERKKLLTKKIRTLLG